MTRYIVTIHRIEDNKRFRRTIEAASEREAFILANRSLGDDALSYYVLSIVPA